MKTAAEMREITQANYLKAVAEGHLRLKEEINAELAAPGISYMRNFYSPFKECVDQAATEMAALGYVCQISFNKNIPSYILLVSWMHNP